MVYNNHNQSLSELSEHSAKQKNSSFSHESNKPPRLFLIHLLNNSKYTI